MLAGKWFEKIEAYPNGSGEIFSSHLPPTDYGRSALPISDFGFKIGVLMVWILSAAFSFCSMILGQYFYLHIDKSLMDCCFEGPHFLAFALLGWLSPGTLVSGIAYFLFWRRKRLAEKKESVHPSVEKILFPGLLPPF